MFQKAETEVESVLGFLMSSLKKTHPFLFHRLFNIPNALKEVLFTKTKSIMNYTGKNTVCKQISNAESHIQL